MFIEWKYNDHGWPDWKELEIPDDFDGWDTVEEYLCERKDLRIPTWSERFFGDRIKWRGVNKTKSQMCEIYRNKIRIEKMNIKFCEDRIREFEALLSHLEA